MPLRTRSGRLTKLGDFERQVKGTMPAHEMYAIANKDNLMRGNKATAHGASAATPHRGTHMPGFAGRKTRRRTGP